MCSRTMKEEGHIDLIAGDLACGDEKKVKDTCIVRLHHILKEPSFSYVLCKNRITFRMHCLGTIQQLGNIIKLVLVLVDRSNIDITVVGEQRLFGCH